MKYVSMTNWKFIGERALPVRSAVAVPAAMNGFLYSLARLATPSAIDEAEPVTTTSTLSRSSQRRAMVMPTSGLFWSSATTTSIGLPATLPPKSSIAMRIANSEPGPPLLA